MTWVIMFVGGGWGGLKIYFTIRDSLNEMKMLFREYPPHRHGGDVNDITYPKGMAPQG